MQNHNDKLTSGIFTALARHGIVFAVAQAALALLSALVSAWGG